jgi:hypothetical protein
MFIAGQEEEKPHSCYGNREMQTLEMERIPPFTSRFVKARIRGADFFLEGFRSFLVQQSHRQVHLGNATFNLTRCLGMQMGVSVTFNLTSCQGMSAGGNATFNLISCQGMQIFGSVTFNLTSCQGMLVWGNATFHLTRCQGMQIYV